MGECGCGCDWEWRKLQLNSLYLSVSVSVSVSLSLQNEMLAQQERLDVQTWFFKSNQKNREILTRSKVLPEGGEKSFMSAVMTAQVR